MRSPTSLYSRLLADAYLQAKRAEDGLVTVSENLQALEGGKRELYRLKGELLLLQNASGATEAESCFRKAIEIARRQHAKSWELRASMSLARLLAKQGRREEAGSMLAEIYGWFTEGFDTADLKDAKALLDELSAQYRRPPDADDSVLLERAADRVERGELFKLERHAPVIVVCARFCDHRRILLHHLPVNLNICPQTRASS